MPLAIDSSRRRALAAGLAIALAPAAAWPRDPAPGVVRVRFADLAEGRAALGADDPWIAATSDFQRAALAGVRPPLSRPAYRSFAAGTVRAWPDAEARRWQAAIDTVLARAAALRVPLPPEILVINTDGRDGANAPYTRGHAIVLPTAALRPANPQLADPFLIAHELFHLVSRQDPALADRLYSTIGFEPVEPLEWPPAWLPARIANPDAPFDRHAMRVEIDGREVLLMPLLVARRTELAAGENVFSVMDVRLLEVTAAPGRPTVAVLRDGAPVWHAPTQLPEYAARLGGNTVYNIHPEETIADNFAQLMTGRTVRNPALLRRIEAVLLAPR